MSCGDRKRAHPSGHHAAPFPEHDVAQPRAELWATSLLRNMEHEPFPRTRRLRLCHLHWPLHESLGSHGAGPHDLSGWVPPPSHRGGLRGRRPSSGRAWGLSGLCWSCLPESAATARTVCVCLSAPAWPGPFPRTEPKKRGLRSPIQSTSTPGGGACGGHLCSD